MDDLTAAIAALQKQITALTPTAPPVTTPLPPPPVVYNPAPPSSAVQLPAPPTADANGHAITYTTPTPATVDVISQTGRALTIDFGSGKVFVFNESDAADMGSYAGSFVSQHRVGVSRADCAFVVWFGTDTAGPMTGRNEFIVELGKMFGAANTACANVPAYTATYYNNGLKIHQEQVPYHFWFSRWRWPRMDRPIVRPNALTGFVPKFSPSAKAPSTSSLAYNFPMDDAGILLQMPTVGDRPEIGLFTEAQAEYIVTGNKSALATLIAQAETAGSVPWHMRDENTGAPIDLIKHPLCHWTYLTYNIKGEEWVHKTQTTWDVDGAHMPALAYVAYLLTDDPYYLEELQFMTGWTIGCLLYHRVNDEGASITNPLPRINPSETREYAWGLRSLFENMKTAPASPPSWLLPQSYYQAVEKVNLDYYNNFLNHAGTPAAGFHFVVDPNICDSWMTSYLVCAISLGVMLGYTEWQAALTYTVYPLKRFSDGKSGWSPQWFAPYTLAAADFTGVTADDWAGLWAKFIADNKIDITKFPPAGTWAQQAIVGQSPYYSWVTRAALAFAAKLGDTEALACFGNVNPMTNAVIANNHLGGCDFRWSIASA